VGVLPLTVTFRVRHVRVFLFSYLYLPTPAGGGASQGIFVSQVTHPLNPEVSEVQILECTCPGDCTGGVMLSW